MCRGIVCAVHGVIAVVGDACVCLLICVSLRACCVWYDGFVCVWSCMRVVLCMVLCVCVCDECGMRCVCVL